MEQLAGYTATTLLSQARCLRHSHISSSIGVAAAVNVLAAKLQLMVLIRSMLSAHLGCRGPAGLARGSLQFLQQLQRQFSSASSASAAEAAAPAGTTVQDPADTLEFPGGRVPFTNSMDFLGGQLTSSSPRIPCYRTVDGTGKQIADAAVPHDLQQPDAVALYTAMAKLQVMDTICYDAQRQVSAELDMLLLMWHDVLSMCGTCS